MIQSPQSIELLRDGVIGRATIAWRYESAGWVVRVDPADIDPVEAVADDAFEALCLVREQLEPLGWLVGVIGAQPGVWPSGMDRDQGGGLTSYRMTVDGASDVVDTFEPADPATVTTIVEQRAEIERFNDEGRRRAQNG